MDFRDTPSEAAFREEVRGWLAAHVPPFRERMRSAPDGRARLEVAAAWQGELLAGGYGALGWPEEHGGRPAAPVERYLVVEDAARAGAPWHLNMAVTLGWCAPALLRLGTDEQRREHLGEMLAGREVWCQMFSEPNAGSDLAALSTRAERDGDHFVVNGQKVWSSGAHWSRWGILLARTGDGPRYRNLTFFIVDMATPGITVRPIRQITGESDFAEVFFTDCRLPAGWVVGEVDAGWTVALYTLLNERVALSAGAGAAVIATQGLERLLGLARSRGGDRLVRQRVAQAYIEAQANRLTGYRVLDAQFKGKQPGPEASILKLSGDLWTQRMSELGMELLGLRGLVTTGDDAGWGDSWLVTRALTIGGGTSEIQRNIIAERVLGLPRARSK